MSPRKAQRCGRGSLTGTLAQRSDNRPGLRGSITIETDMTLRAGSHLYLVGWIRPAPGGVEFVSIVVERDPTAGGRAGAPREITTHQAANGADDGN